MPSIVDRLTRKQLITPPSWLVSNVLYETIMGSVAFGVSTDTSDFDTVDFCVPPKDMIFPHLAGHIVGFGRSQSGLFAIRSIMLWCKMNWVARGRCN